jgi:phenylpyruvate tautomerase PptA (4-oxalocrotonate tautomerase family)
MPLWIIYHPPTTFTSTSTKTALANAITDIYVAANLPRFYVNVLFQPIQPESFFIGGVARPSPATDANKPGPDSTVPMIRIRIEHLARQM